MRRGIKVAALLPVLALSWRTPQFADSPLDDLVSLFQHQETPYCDLLQTTPRLRSLSSASALRTLSLFRMPLRR